MRTILKVDWAYRQVITSNDDRAAALAPWLECDNTRRRARPQRSHHLSPRRGIALVHAASKAARFPDVPLTGYAAAKTERPSKISLCSCPDPARAVRP
jgi:hypothetical protein